jgi:carbon storage regulator CsrA
MLVLTRKLQEKIHIGDDVTVTILKVKGRTVRLGIEAPRQVRVIRGELPPASPDAERRSGGTAGDRSDAPRIPSDRRRVGGPREDVRVAEGVGGVSAVAGNVGAGRGPLTSLVQESTRIAPVAAAAF